FIIAVLAGYLISFALAGAWRRIGGDLGMMALGVTPMLVLIVSFKAFLAPAHNPVETFEHVASVERYHEIVRGFWDQVKDFGGTWHTGGIHPGVLVVIFLLLYVPTIKKIKTISLALLLFMAFMLSGYAVLYLVSSARSVTGYIGNSLDRLYLQLW